MITLPWGEQEAAYVADMLRSRAQGRVEMARLLKPGVLVDGFITDLAEQAIKIEGLAMDLLVAKVTNEREEEDDLGAVRTGADRPDPGGVDG